MRDVVAGIGYLARGFAFWGRRPKVMMLGVLPGLLAALLIGAALLLLVFNIVDIATWLVGFAEGWSEWLLLTLRVIAGTLVFIVALWLAAVTFTTLTLIVGDPFYDAISATVDNTYGPPAEISTGLIVSIRHSIADAMRLIGLSVGIAVLLFGMGLIPVAGPAIALIVGAVLGGLLLTIELTSFAYNRRGMRYKEYRKVVRERKALAVSFGTVVFLLFLIPLGAIVVMPAAVAGATLLARDTLRENTKHRLPTEPSEPTESSESATAV